MFRCAWILFKLNFPDDFYILNDILLSFTQPDLVIALEQLSRMTVYTDSIISCRYGFRLLFLRLTSFRILSGTREIKKSWNHFYIYKILFFMFRNFRKSHSWYCQVVKPPLLIIWWDCKNPRTIFTLLDLG